MSLRERERERERQSGICFLLLRVIAYIKHMHVIKRERGRERQTERARERNRVRVGNLVFYTWQSTIAVMRVRQGKTADTIMIKHGFHTHHSHTRKLLSSDVETKRRF